MMYLARTLKPQFWLTYTRLSANMCHRGMRNIDPKSIIYICRFGMELTHEPSTVIVGSVKEKEQCIELGFVDRLIQLWRLRKSILEAKAEMLVSGTLAKYTYRAGEAIMSKTLTYKSSYMSQLFKARNASITKEEKRLAALTIYENFIC